ncbi:hypothetical protein TWF481_003825 [Arthrobotrys musiformis]|uniref:Dynamin N-terminal domain-containing protein n=1 Tax=Arthrobotrys musiformis TaxID=47236 RepID=A0AAV9WIV9_9PEZI
MDSGSSEGGCTLRRAPNEIDQCLQNLTKQGKSFLQLCVEQLKKMERLNILNEDGERLLNTISTYPYENIEPDSKAIIAFVGETGEGKSTLLNALLGQGEIAPTSGSSACTCVATEFSSRTPGMQSRFYAVVEYISHRDFDEELHIIRQEIQDRGGTVDYDNVVDGDTTIDDSETRSEHASSRHSTSSYDTAMDKLKALFPGFQEYDLPGISERVEALYELKPLKDGRMVIESDNRDEFTDIVSEVVSTTSTSDGDGPQLWPLVKVVRIHLDAPVLRTGAILVDLPGIQDSNAARAAVMKRYLDKADEVIIVSRLARAQDREATTNLAKAEYLKNIELSGKTKLSIAYKPSDARKDFKTLPGFLERFTELSKKSEKLSKEDQQILSRGQIKLHKQGMEAAKKELQEYCRQTLNEEMPKRLSQNYRKLFGENIEVRSFLAAATNYEELDDTDSEDDEVDKTQIPKLREYCMRIPVERRACRASVFIEFDTSTLFGEVKLFLMNVETNLSPETLAAIRTQLHEAATKMKKVFSIILRIF